jgi:demethylmenaquinone methyltransferase / 2-methoxy-6-polyprenyl-1,4-benzoquinol methylase
MDNTQPKISKDKELIAPMFDSIAWRYDFLNHLLSLGIDRLWRKRAIAMIPQDFREPRIIDVATGTGDFAIAAMKVHPCKVCGIDISEKMLELGRRKVIDKGLDRTISFINCESENICLEDNSFDIALSAFGVRNFSDPVKGLSEMNRVLRHGGMIIILEFSKPVASPFRQIYSFYFRNILPLAGRLFSRDRKAYRYLNESVMEFPEGEEFIGLMTEAGFVKSTQTSVSWGIASIYSGFKE